MEELIQHLKAAGWTKGRGSDRASEWTHPNRAPVIVPAGITPDSYEWPDVLHRIGLPTPCRHCGGTGTRPGKQATA